MIKFWRDLASWFTDGRLLTVSSRAERALMSFSLLVRVPALLDQGCTLRTLTSITYLKSLAPNPVTLTSTYTFGGDTVQSTSGD